MSEPESIAAKPLGIRAAEVFTKLTTGDIYPVLITALAFVSAIHYRVAIMVFLGPLIIIGMARGFYRRWSDRPPLRPKSRNQLLAMQRSLKPAALLAATLIVGIFMGFITKGSRGGVWELILFPTVAAIVLRVAWNASLAHVYWGALTAYAYFAFAQGEHFWIPVLALTLSAYLGYALVLLKRHDLAQIFGGFATGAASIALWHYVYIPYLVLPHYTMSG